MTLGIATTSVATVALRGIRQQVSQERRRIRMPGRRDDQRAPRSWPLLGHQHRFGESVLEPCGQMVDRVDDESTGIPQKPVLRLKGTQEGPSFVPEYQGFDEGFDLASGTYRLQTPIAATRGSVNRPRQCQLPGPRLSMHDYIFVALCRQPRSRDRGAKVWVAPNQRREAILGSESLSVRFWRVASKRAIVRRGVARSLK